VVDSRRPTGALQDEVAEDLRGHPALPLEEVASPNEDEGDGYRTDNGGWIHTLASHLCEDKVAKICGTAVRTRP
jgi:hypothetical protein